MDSLPHDQKGPSRKPPNPDMEGKYQVVTIVLSDGTEGKFTGPAIGEVSDIRKLRVVSVQMTPPYPLPPGTLFRNINEEGDK